MIRIMFICLGNICRSPMAEFVFRRLVEEKHLSDRFIIASSATSREEIGNPVHRETVKKLQEVGISCEGKRAVQLTKKDYDAYDYLVCMETGNIKNALKILGDDTEGKLHRLLDFGGSPGDIADPWYTGDFDKTYHDIKSGSEALLEYIVSRNPVQRIG